MATWEDGPEYAPLEPPAAFTTPDAPPLSVAEPRPEPAEVPAQRPEFGDPSEQVAPLATLVPDIGGEQRDPHTPFEVDSDAMTQSGGGGGAWGAAHWRPPSGPPAGAAGPWGPPAGAPVGQPTEPMALQSGPAAVPGNLPAPGTPAWFGPGPAAPVRQQPPPGLFKATPPGAIIVLALSVFWIIAPPAFLLAFILSARARYARRKILTAFAVVGAVVLLIPTIDSFANYGDLSSWYSLLSTWSLLGSLLMIVLILALVNTELKGQRGPQHYPQHQLPPYGPPHQDQPPHDQQRHDRQQWPPTGQ